MSGLLHQATCVAIDGRALLIEGPPGSGKSSLALALIDRGATLVGDDGVLLESRAGVLLASPAPATAGKLEVRNLGLLEFPHSAEVAVALMLSLDPEAERWIEAAGTCQRGGIALPLVRLWPETPVLQLRAELALSRYGLPVTDALSPAAKRAQ